MDSLAGHFLIASPAIIDPNFQRAVVLITAHNDQGAIGLILNRCSEATVGEAVPQLAPVIDMDEPVFVGAPSIRTALRCWRSSRIPKRRASW